jgi:hypothetical protein
METNSMKHSRYDDPENFKECVSAITLIGRPEGLLEDWLTEADVHITVALGPKKSQRMARPWLSVEALDELPWSGRICKAVIESDHLETSSGLYMLSNVQDLTIVVLGKSFSEGDIQVFQNAIINLPKLKHLRVVVAASAYNAANECTIGLATGHGSGVAIEVIVNTNPHGKRNS